MVPRIARVARRTRELPDTWTLDLVAPDGAPLMRLRARPVHHDVRVRRRRNTGQHQRRCVRRSAPGADCAGGCHGGLHRLEGRGFVILGARAAARPRRAGRPPCQSKNVCSNGARAPRERPNSSVDQPTIRWLARPNAGRDGAAPPAPAPLERGPEGASAASSSAWRRQRQQALGQPGQVPQQRRRLPAEGSRGRSGRNRPR